MQIFASDPSPYISAIVLDNARLGKMIIEAGQILSSVWGGPYKATHTNHPAMKWCRDDWRNYNWLLWHYYSLSTEWFDRFGKHHGASRWYKFFTDMLEKNGIIYYKETEITHINMTDFKHIPDVYEAYKQALISKWDNDKRAPKWTNREKPDWYISDLNRI